MQSDHDRDLMPGKHFPADRTPPGHDDILQLLSQYGFTARGEMRLIDSSRGADDLRLNYIIDRKWVLRLCNAPEMTEKRLTELNRLIARYNAFGLVCPSFLTDPEGRFFHAWRGLTCCLSEYVDLPTADSLPLTEAEKETLRLEVLDSVAGFAERYRNADLSDTMGMYSLFDLSPFDRPIGKDEKQQNFDSLCSALRAEGQLSLAGCLEEKHARIRNQLKAVYRGLPRCVFQADENLSNVLVNEEHHLAGLIDFNLAGTEVVVNQFANLCGGFDSGIKKTVGARTRMNRAMDGCRKDRERMLGIYHATDAEKQAMEGYTWIALTAGWPQVCFFLEGLKDDALRKEVIELLWLLTDGPYM